MYQSRADVVARRLEISVTNGSGADLLVSDAQIVSDQFVETAAWKKESTLVRAGRTVDLPVALPDPACDVAEPRPIVRLSVDSGGDEPTEYEVTPIDERARLPELRAEECFVQTVKSVADLRVQTLPRTTTVAGRIAAQIDVTVVPSTSNIGETVTLDSAAGTTLFTVLDARTGQTQTSFPIGVEFPTPDGAPLTLTLVPNRCDPHAVAEDKRGTLFPLIVTVADESSDTGSTTGELYVAADASVKAALLDFVATACGFKPTG